MNVQNPPKFTGNGAGPRGRKPRRTPKGRQVEPKALEEVQALLGDRSRQRDLLIEHLHLIQDEYGHLSAAHLTALAHESESHTRTVISGGACWPSFTTSKCA